MDQEWLNARFDKIDQDNDDIKKDLKIVSDTVVQHGVYWSMVKWGVGAVGGTIIAGISAVFFGHKPH